MGNEALSRWVAGDHREGADLGYEGTEGVAVIGRVGEDMAWTEAIKQGRRLGDIPSLPGREDDTDGPSPGIGSEMDFGGQTSSGAPQSLVLVITYRIFRTFDFDGSF